jgi:hypothetical protein
VKSPLAAAILLGLALSSTQAHAASPVAAKATSASQARGEDARFQAIYEKEWQWRQSGGGEAARMATARPAPPACPTWARRRRPRG